MTEKEEWEQTCEQMAAEIRTTLQRGTYLKVLNEVASNLNRETTLEDVIGELWDVAKTMRLTDFVEALGGTMRPRYQRKPYSLLKTQQVVELHKQRKQPAEIARVLKMRPEQVLEIISLHERHEVN
jgi:anaerobic glycerol-3-phosphate dehydrogenase